ncbi:hypothetical protein [Bradyrhizobium sp.]|uniref:hypothetical protein n=1 Tax=Bradyrhizobium sp. TaxID=376 RepID=UPI003D0CCD3B
MHEIDQDRRPIRLDMAGVGAPEVRYGTQRGLLFLFDTELLCSFKTELLDLCESALQRGNTAVHADYVVSKFADKRKPQQGVLQQLFALNCHVAIKPGQISSRPSDPPSSN